MATMRDGRARPKQLTATEREIATLVARGRTNAEIACALGLRPKTVEWHLTRVYRNLGLRSRVELAARIGAARVAGKEPLGRGAGEMSRGAGSTSRNFRSTKEDSP